MTEQTQLPAPDWHDRPTVPGLWVVMVFKLMEPFFVARMLTQEEIAAGDPIYVDRVYGPIPPDPQCHG